MVCLGILQSIQERMIIFPPKDLTFQKKKIQRADDQVDTDNFTTLHPIPGWFVLDALGGVYKVLRCCSGLRPQVCTKQPGKCL